MALINQLERKAGWLAIPGIVRIIMSFQVLVWVLVIIQSANSTTGEIGIAELLYLDFDKIKSGEIWRLVSFVALPPTFRASGIVIMLFAFFFTCFLGSLLEGIWGSFRTTLYVLGWVAGCVLASALLSLIGGGSFFGGHILLGYPGNSFFFSVLIFAVAIYHPKLEVNLFGIIPVKMMWLAIFDGGIVAVEVLRYLPKAWMVSVAILLSFSVFFVVFGPGMRRTMKLRGETAERRRRFEDAKVSVDEAMHTCATCGKTERDDADLVFRVTADGEEYCDRCREAT